MQSNQRQKELRRFGQVIALASALLSGLLFWRQSSAAPFVLGAGAVVGGLSLLAPGVLEPFERVWMALARIMAAVMTVVMLTLTFLLMITPLGVVLRLFGKDLIDRKLDPNATTYWTAVEPDGPATRPRLPY